MHTSRLIVLLGGGLFLIVCASLLRSILLSRQAHQALEEQEVQVRQLEQEVAELEKTVQEASSSFELERRVREELNRQKPGEQVIELNTQ